MRLIRLNTFNNATFDCNFNTPIEIEPNSKMALQNITLELEGELLEITAANQSVTSAMPERVLADPVEALIPEVNVGTIESQEEFLHQVSGALNKTLVDTSELACDEDKGVFGGSEYVVREHKNQRNNELLLHLSPLLPPFLGLPVNVPGLSQQERTAFEKDETYFQYSNAIGKSVSIGDRFSYKQGAPLETTPDRLTNTLTLNEGLSICRGSGTMAFQIEDSVDNGQGGGAGATNNGFGFGLTFGNAGDVTNPDAEVFFNRVGEAYSFIPSKGAGRQTSGFNPLKVSATTHTDLTTHDVMVLQVQQGNITGYIAQDSAGNGGADAEQVLFMTAITDAQQLLIQKEGLNAYMYFTADERHVKICNARVTLSPFVYQGPHRDDNDNILKAAINTRDLSVPGFDAASNIRKVLPFRFSPTNDQRLGAPRKDTTAIAPRTFQIGIHESIQRFLGFKPLQLINNDDNLLISNGVYRRIADGEQNYTYSDFFIIESQTLQLDSFNGVPDKRLDDNMDLGQTMKMPLVGDRKSILATVPVSQSLGFVVFETNNPVFIDIRNINEDSIRNLKFRILDEDFKEIRTALPTNMTILIAGPKESL